MHQNTWQFKFFIYWFIAFFISAITAMVTHSEIAITIVLSLLMIVGVVMLFTTGKDAALSIISKSWPTTEFSVLNSGVSRSTSPGKGAGINYKAYFEIGYQVSGSTYTLSCHAFNIPFHSSIEEAETYIADVRKGKYGRYVYYNPDHPEQAYVKPGIRFQQVLAISFGLGFVLVPLVFMLGYL